MNFQTVNSDDLNRDSNIKSLFLPTPFSSKLLTNWNFSIVSANLPVRSDSIPFTVIFKKSTSHTQFIKLNGAI